VLGVFKKIQTEYCIESISKQISLALDEIQDPGNLGTIVRIADWFGIKDIFCSINSCDAYNPKTVQATMGAIGRVKIHYIDLLSFIQKANKHMPVFGTFLNGTNIYTEKLSPNGIIVMGNEGNGISHEIEQLIDNKLFIPNFPLGEKTSESLNVATATAIICSEFRRRMI
jgi:TrmH family RNA methyltransferase